MPQAPVAAILKSAYQKKKAMNPRFTLGVFARKLNVSVSFVSQVLNGLRNLPVHLVEEFCAILDLDQEKRDLVTHAVLKRKNLRASVGVLDPSVEIDLSATELQVEYVPEAKFSVLRDWMNLAILDCTLLKDYDGTCEFIAKRLGIGIDVVFQRCEELEEFGFLKREDGWLKKSTAYLDFHSLSKDRIQEYHASSMHRAIDEMKAHNEPEDLENRLISTYTFTLSRRKIASGKLKIKGLMDALIAESNGEPEEELYQLSVQFFPLTRS